MRTKKTAAKRFPVREDMTIYHATEQKAQLLSALTATQHLELDLKAVAEMDTAGLQLLLLLKREAGAQGKNVSVINHSPRVQQVLDFCNLVGTFGDPMVISAHWKQPRKQPEKQPANQH